MSKLGEFKKILKKAVEIAKEFGFEISQELVIYHYSESHRHWHTPQHLYEMLQGITILLEEDMINLKEYKILMVAAIFHDIIYDTKRKDNEEQSVEYMLSLLNRNVISEDVIKIRDIIIDTKRHDSKEKLSKFFNQLDTSIVDAPFMELLDWEDKIWKEYKWFGWETYKEKRLDFLNNYALKNHPGNEGNLKKLIDYISIKENK
jgi:pantetheine-phosphate adenylyltransferase